MNKNLIQEIEVQASEYAWTSLLAENETPAELMREKFAELIIVKCIDICSDNHYMTGDGYAELIREYFGVEP